jgi:CubicO group peptidase (beta-lactamase class C family)
VRELEPAPAHGLLDLVVTGDDGAERTLAAFLDESYTDALVVLDHGRIALEWYAQGVFSDEPHILMSVTKSVTALLAGALARSGQLDLEGPLEQYVPEAAGSCFEGATVRHLLDMTVDTSFVEDYAPGDDVRAYRRTFGWYPPEGDGPALHAYLCTIRGGGAHGEAFHYVSPNTDMLGWVCERAGGQRYADALSTYIWAPLGAEADADVTVDREGAMRAAGGLCAVPRDMARLGQLVVEDGAGLVDPEFVRDLREGGDPAVWARGDYADLLPGGAYRNLWYQPRQEPGVAVAIGIHGQLVYADPVREVVVAKQSSWPVAGDDAGDRLAIAASRAIAAALAG